MVERASPLASDFRPGSYGDFADGTGITISEARKGTIIEASSWPGQEGSLAEALSAICHLKLSARPGNGATNREGTCAFNIGPGRFLVSGQDEALAGALSAAIDATIGTVTDLSHGRTVFTLEGPAVEWVLSKLFALDFDLSAFPVHAGRATAHHDLFVQIQRRAETRFELYLFRSFAKAFADTLRHASQDVGYTIT
ncbi:sarcosine oxidase subunit gamma [Nitratireductor kimnyeongensis]|uniref:Sarcosine oxidase subunit gamma n=1 Tax=Nitratireductor kimnyeongensis TaxID=430679 RepID=A0ABW0T8Q9_9HYPH|nr:sarcosine oxidase subunit gamma family protein [Nitratireductor kimnyeongensis]QZZ35860.1 sarcosine oxidase subunit gamma [Nitratireductor kimnyeongensis]